MAFILSTQEEKLLTSRIHAALNKKTGIENIVLDVGNKFDYTIDTINKIFTVKDGVIANSSRVGQNTDNYDIPTLPSRFYVVYTEINLTTNEFSIKNNESIGAFDLPSLDDDLINNLSGVSQKVMYTFTTNGVGDITLVSDQRTYENKILEDGKSVFQFPKLTNTDGTILSTGTSGTFNNFFTGLNVGMHTVKIPITMTGKPTNVNGQSLGIIHKHEANSVSHPFGKVWAILIDNTNEYIYSGNFSGTSTITSAMWEDLSTTTLFERAQIGKITDDNGYISKNNTNQSMNAFFTSLPVGLHTISVTDNATGVPLSGAKPSIFGQAMKYEANSPTHPFGKVWCFVTDAVNNFSYSGHFSGTSNITSSSWKSLSQNSTLILSENADLNTEFADLVKFPYGSTTFLARKNTSLPNSSNSELFTYSGYPLTVSNFFVGTVNKVLGSTPIQVTMTDTLGHSYSRYKSSMASSWSGWKSGTSLYNYTPLTTAIPATGHTETIISDTPVLDSGATVRFIFTTGNIVEIPLKSGFLNQPVWFMQNSATGAQKRTITLTGGNNWTISSATAISGSTFATTISKIEIIFD